MVLDLGTATVVAAGVEGAASMLTAPGATNVAADTLGTHTFDNLMTDEQKALLRTIANEGAAPAPIVSSAAITGPQVSTSPMINAGTRTFNAPDPNQLAFQRAVVNPAKTLLNEKLGEVANRYAGQGTGSERLNANTKITGEIANAVAAKFAENQLAYDQLGITADKYATDAQIGLFGEQNKANIGAFSAYHAANTGRRNVDATNTATNMDMRQALINAAIQAKTKENVALAIGGGSTQDPSLMGNIMGGVNSAWQSGAKFLDPNSYFG